MTTRWPCGAAFKRAHPVGLQQHVDHTRRAVAPVHQQVPLVPDARRVVARSKFEATHVVDAGLHQSVDVLLGANKSWLRRGGANTMHVSVQCTSLQPLIGILAVSALLIQHLHQTVGGIWMLGPDITIQKTARSTYFLR